MLADETAVEALSIRIKLGRNMPLEYVVGLKASSCL
jgi:hypothetical protein